MARSLSGDETQERASSSAPAVTRAAALLDLVAAAGASLSLSELARQLDLPKSSTANICLALEHANLLSRDSLGYALGRKTLELGGAYLAGVDEVQRFYELCASSALVSQETARVAILDGLDVLYLARHDGRQPLRLTAGIGDRFPASCTATGKALMARLPESVLEDRLRGRPVMPALTERSLRTAAELRVELARTRERGWAIDDEETTPGVTCFAVAASGSRTDSTEMAVSATILTARITDELQRNLLAELTEIAAQMGNPLIPALRPVSGIG